MSRNWYKMLLTGLLWLAPVVIGLRYRQVWDRLPPRMASHFDAVGRANGWLPREVSLYFTLGFLALLLTILSFVLFTVHSRYPLAKLWWVLLAFFHVEIWTVVYMLNSTLGFRLKSIPLIQIKQYEIGEWSLARGYGIRGIGNQRAYVWGNRGVRVEMYDGEIFLGHSDPQRIVHDLNVIKRYQHS